MLPKVKDFKGQVSRKRVLISNKSQSLLKVATWIQTPGLITLISRGKILIQCPLYAQPPSLQLALYNSLSVMPNGDQNQVLILE